jgi:maltooligosyltrehalose trehalohydrolase
VRPGGGVEFRVWAPRASRVEVRIAGATQPLALGEDGIAEGLAHAADGDDYLVVLDGDPWPDPCSRHQPAGVRGPSRVVDPGRFTWTDDGWPGLRLADLVLYELHVGTFTREGTFDAVAGQLGRLRDLGVTAIELMPIASFPGERNWGYDGLQIFAPHQRYGGPDGLARLVDAAHAAGVGVLLDVVYNHVGPGAEALAAFGPYFDGGHRTPWGEGMNFCGADSDPVREWAIQNACQWVRDYHVDGLRLDAVHAIVDTGARPLLAELTDRVRRESRREVLLIAESAANDPRVLREEPCGLGFDAQWNDDFHHALRTAITGERGGYYADFGGVGDLATALGRPFVYEGRWSSFRRRRHGAPGAEPATERYVVYGQNHDQVGNRAGGDRLTGAALRMAAFWTLLSPYTPMLFMGEEYGERRPFQYFTDHIDPAIAEAAREGRRREFAAFDGFSGALPDPQDPETFARSVLRPDQGDAQVHDLYAQLLRLRARLAGTVVEEVAAEAEAGTLRARRGGVWLLGNFSTETRTLDPEGEVAVATTPVERGRGGMHLPPRSAVAVTA